MANKRKTKWKTDEMMCTDDLHIEIASFDQLVLEPWIC